MPRRRERGARGGVVLIAAVCLSASFACGSDSSISVTSPSSNARCAVTATADMQSASSSGGAGALTIGVNRECSWTANADVDWVAFGGATSGQGPATIPFTVAPNVAVQPRRARLAVNDQQVEITQGAAPCRFALDRQGEAIGAAGGVETVRVTAQAGCEWRAVSQESWVAIASPAAGQGEGSVSLRIETNTQPQPREGAVTIADISFRVSQAAAIVPPPTNPPGTPTPTPPTPGVPPTPAPPEPTPPAPTPTPTPTPPAPAPTPPAPTPAPPAPTPTPTPTPTPPAPTPPPPTTVVLEGKASKIEGPCPTRTFVVEDRTVLVTAQTSISGGDCKDIKNKVTVQVRGVVTSNDVVAASSVNILDKDEKDAESESAGGRSSVP
jgi:hypothetical protein